MSVVEPERKPHLRLPPALGDGVSYNILPADASLTDQEFLDLQEGG